MNQDYKRLRDQLEQMKKYWETEDSSDFREGGIKALSDALQLLDTLEMK